MAATRPSTEFTWATSGTKTAPSAAQKLSGWVFRQRPAYDLVNWLYGLIGDWFAYLDGGGGFDSLHAADAALAAGEHAIVDEWGAAGVPGEPRTSAGGNSGSASLIACDGRTVFYVRSDTANTVRTYDRALGTAGSTFVASSSPIVSIASDGTTIFIASGSASTWTVDAYTIASGASAGSWSVGTASPRLAAYLGDVIVVGDNVNGAGADVVRYTAAGSAVWSYNHGAALTTVATSGRYVFVGGAAGTGSSTLRCLSGAAGTVVWASAPTTPTVLGADQRAVFVDANGTLQRRGAADGAVVSSISTLGGAPVAASLDHEYLWIVEAGSERVAAYDAETLAVAIIGTTITAGTGDGLSIASDGASVYVGRSSTGTSHVVSRCYRPNVPARFRKCAVTDLRDFPHLIFAPSTR